MSESLFYFLLGLPLAILLGYVTNLLFLRFHRPAATIYLSSPTGWRSWQNKLIRLERYIRKTKIPQITVCTDGSFIDTAVFFLVAIEASRKIHEADIIIRHVEWDNVKHEFGNGNNVVAYVNRRNLSRIDAPVTIWSNLAAFKGYALLGRAADFQGDLSTLAEANHKLQQLSRTRRLRIITNGADSVDVLNTPLTPVLNAPNVDVDIDPATDGLERFLRGRGDLFIAGLPQLLKAKRAGMVEVMSSENHPLMLGIEAMVYDEESVPIRVLEQISASWSHVCRKIVSDLEYTRNMYADWIKVAGEIGCDLCFPEEDFLLATYGEPGKYISFFANRDDAAEEIIRTTELIMDEGAALGMTPRNTRKALRALRDIYFGQPDTV